MVSSNDVQRLFLQAALSRKVMSHKLALKIWEKCVDAVKAANDSLDIPFYSDRNSWDTFVSNINDVLNPLDLEFAHLLDEISGKELYALVNRKDDDVAQMATDYSPIEIAYFKAVVEQIMLAPNESFCVSSLVAMREVNSLKSNMTKAQAEIVLGSFVAKGWLMKSKRGRYSLSTRTLLELQPYLRSTYPDEILECTICLEMVTRGVACYTPQCKARLHNHCYASYRRGKRNCPTCDENWSVEANTKKLKPVGEAAFKEGQDQGRRRVRRKATDSDEENSQEEEDDEDDNDEMIIDNPENSRPSQTQAKKKAKRKIVHDASMDIDRDIEDDAPPPRTQRKARR